jgi:hypothetical protein
VSWRRGRFYIAESGTYEVRVADTDAALSNGGGEVVHVYQVGTWTWMGVEARPGGGYLVLTKLCAVVHRRWST